MTETGLREEICRLGRSLFERGLTPGSSGKISVQTDDGGWLVTPTNASLGSLDPARMSRLDASGRLLSGDTLEAAVFAIEELEETAKLYLLLRGLNPRYLSPEQVYDLSKVFGLTLPDHGHD